MLQGGMPIAAGHELGPTSGTPQGLAFDRGDGPPVEVDRVVPTRQAAPDGADLLVGELVGVALVGVDHDLQLDDAGGSGGGQSHVGPGLFPGAG
jgi:hypothetical protein